MPVSFSVANHAAAPVDLSMYLASDGFTAEQILAHACQQRKKPADVLQFAVSQQHLPLHPTPHARLMRDVSAKIPNLLPDQNGFVASALTAYNGHHALVLRPDDVWLAILCQFNFFVNAHAERLRAAFVAHDGKRLLAVDAPGGRHRTDFPGMARAMAGLIHANVVDPALRDWALPAFSTTTVHDTTVAAALLMATLKEYFVYAMFGSTLCGIPRVTLEGGRADWFVILERLEKLREYGVETTAWYHLLRPVVARFVAAFDAPVSAANMQFWQQIAGAESGGSGTSCSSTPKASSSLVERRQRSERHAKAGGGVVDVCQGQRPESHRMTTLFEFLLVFKALLPRISRARHGYHWDALLLENSGYDRGEYTFLFGVSFCSFLGS
ncbi:hypothetical protein FB451DRAFT_1448656 [Mycena latifolia]|nr:hypothetical protein FB451DRAFT_1448656 [Mycena latifolia]